MKNIRQILREQLEPNKYEDVLEGIDSKLKNYIDDCAIELSNLENCPS